MSNKWFAWMAGGLLVVGLAVVGVLVVDGGGRRGPVSGTVTLAQAAVPAAQDQPAQSDAVQLVGAYNGSVKLNVTVAGVYSDTLATPPPPGAGTPAPPDLGSIDFSVQFYQNGSAVNGYVSLDQTLVYSVEHTVGSGVKIGPYLSGALNNGVLTVQSEQVALSVSGRPVQRQFRLVSTNIANNGAQITGEYRETLWGYTNYPITVIGDFTLQRVGSTAIVPVTGGVVPNVGADTTTTQGGAVTINVLGNDSPANGGTLTILSVSKPQFGTATTDGKTVTYTPNAGFSGTDTFSYVVSDGKGGLGTGFVTVTVNGPGGPNQSPTASADNVGTLPGAAVTINVLGNDSDPNGDPLVITIDSPPSHGTAVVQNGQIVYTPAAGYTGLDSFTYIVSDGRGGTATAKVTINVSPTGLPLATSLYLPRLGR